MIDSLSIIIPVYNASLTLDDLLAELARTLPALARQFEVICVEDGSRDASWEKLRALSATYPFLLAVRLMRNYGQHNALLCGIRMARFATIVTMDDDLEHPPEEIATLLDTLAEGHDVVYGTPIQEQHGLWRDLASRITKLALQSAIGAETARKVSAFRAFRTQVRDAFACYTNPSVSIDVLLTWGTTRFGSVAVRHQARRAGVSNYTFRKLLTHALNMMTGFSVMPLQLASLVGFVFMLLGLAAFVYVIAGFLIAGRITPGFTFLASIVTVLSGAQLFAIGIIGEYLARMHFRMMDRPTYVVRETVKKGTEGT
jgi:undecaprenyl-phosphate 4-deoxy-4-formamido-L-arabinose transferase